MSRERERQRKEERQARNQRNHSGKDAKYGMCNKTAMPTATSRYSPLSSGQRSWKLSKSCATHGKWKACSHVVGHSFAERKKTRLRSSISSTSEPRRLERRKGARIRKHPPQNEAKLGFALCQRSTSYPKRVLTRHLDEGGSYMIDPLFHETLAARCWSASWSLSFHREPRPALEIS